MRISQAAEGFVAETPAKLNLFFEVLGKRSDGYHEIETLMCPIDLFDSLYFVEKRGGRLELQCEVVAGVASPGEAAAVESLEGAANLAFRAVELLRRRAGLTAGAMLRLVKRIPIAAGLGGGSSDAAAALALANRGWRLRWPKAKLMALAAELGSDVPFFLAGGPAICRGRGEQVEQVEAIGPLHFVLIRPPSGLSTAAVYAACRPAAEPQSFAGLLGALQQGDLRHAGRLLWNRLQPAAESLSPWIGRLQRELALWDVLGQSMSGSGTCYFGLCRHARHARRMAGRLRAAGIGSVFAVRSCR